MCVCVFQCNINQELLVGLNYACDEDCQTRDIVK